MTLRRKPKLKGQTKTMADVDYSPMLDSSLEDQSLFINTTTAAAANAKHTPTLRGTYNKNQKHPHSLFDDSLLEDEKPAATRRREMTQAEMQERMDHMIETMQIPIESVANDPLVQKLSDSTRDLILAQCQDDISSTNSGSVRSRSKGKRKNRRTKKSTTRHAGRKVSSSDPCFGCDVFSVMERYMDGMDEECADLNDSTTTHGSSTKTKHHHVKFSTSPSDVRHFNRDLSLMDSSLETYKEYDDLDQTLDSVELNAAGRRSSSARQDYYQQPPAAQYRYTFPTDESCAEVSDTTPCHHNRRRSVPPETQRRTTTTNVNQVHWEEELHRTIREHQTHNKPCLGVKRFFGLRKCKKVQCHEQH